MINRLVASVVALSTLSLTVLGGVAGCSSSTSNDDADTTTDDALTASGPASYVLVRVNTTKNKGDAFIAPANGGTMKCAAGNTASSCLATLDLSGVTGGDGAALSAAEASAAKATFLAGAGIVQGAYVKGGNTIAATKAWSSVTATPAATSTKLWLVTPTGTNYKDTEVGTTTIRYAQAVDLSSLKLTADVEASVRAGIATNGAVVRGTHHATTLGADAVFAPVAHVAVAASGLTAAQEATALHDIDSLCGDTWCDGDYNFRFDTLTCDFTTGTCILNLEVTYPNDGSPDAKWLPGTCTLTPYKTFSDLVTIQSPTASAITAPLSNDMFNCTQAVEATVPK